MTSQMVYAQPVRLQTTKTYSKIKNNVKRRKRKDRSNRRSTSLVRPNIVFPQRLDESIFKSDDSLRDDYWMDEFDRLAQGKTPLRKKNLLVKAVRADYNRDSSIDCTPKALTPPIHSRMLTPSRTPIFLATPMLTQSIHYNRRATTPAATVIYESQSPSDNTLRAVSDGILLTQNSKVAGSIVKRKFFKDFVPNRLIEMSSDDSLSSLDELLLRPHQGDHRVRASVDSSKGNEGNGTDRPLHHSSYEQNDLSAIQEQTCSMDVNEILSPINCGNVVSECVEDNSLYDNRLQACNLNGTSQNDNFGEFGRSQLRQNGESDPAPRIPEPSKSQKQSQQNSSPRRIQGNCDKIKNIQPAQQSSDSQSRQNATKMTSKQHVNQNKISKSSIPIDNCKLSQQIISKKNIEKHVDKSSDPGRQTVSNPSTETKKMNTRLKVLKNVKQANKEISSVSSVHKGNINEGKKELKTAENEPNASRPNKYQLRRAKTISSVPMTELSADLAQSYTVEFRNRSAVVKVDRIDKQISKSDRKEPITAVVKSNSMKQDTQKQKTNKASKQSKPKSSVDPVSKDNNLKSKKCIVRVPYSLQNTKTVGKTISEPQHFDQVQKDSPEIPKIIEGNASELTKISSKKSRQCKTQPEAVKTILSNDKKQKSKSKDDFQTKNNFADRKKISKHSVNNSTKTTLKAIENINVDLAKPSLPERYSLRSKIQNRLKSFDTEPTKHAIADSSNLHGNKHANKSVDCLPIDQQVTTLQVNKNKKRILRNQKQRKDLLEIDEKYIKKRAQKTTKIKECQTKSTSETVSMERDYFVEGSGDSLDKNSQNPPSIVISQACNSSSQPSIALGAIPVGKSGRVIISEHIDGLSESCLQSEKQLMDEQIKSVPNPTNLRRVKVKIKRLAVELITGRRRRNTSSLKETSNLAERTNMVRATETVENSSNVPSGYLNTINPIGDQEILIGHFHESNTPEIISEINRESAITCQITMSPCPVKRRRLEVRLKRMSSTTLRNARQLEKTQKSQSPAGKGIVSLERLSTISSNELNQSLDSCEVIPHIHESNTPEIISEINRESAILRQVTISPCPVKRRQIEVRLKRMSSTTLRNAKSQMRNKEHHTERPQSADLRLDDLAETIEESQNIPLELANITDQHCSSNDASLFESPLKITHRIETPFDPASARRESIKSVGSRSDRSKEIQLIVTSGNESEISLVESVYSIESDLESSIDSLLDFSEFMVNNLASRKSCTDPIAIHSDDSISQENEPQLFSDEENKVAVTVPSSEAKKSTVNTLENPKSKKPANTPYHISDCETEYIEDLTVECNEEALGTVHESLETPAQISSEVHNTLDKTSNDTTHSNEIISSILSKKSTNGAIIDRTIPSIKRVRLNLENTAGNSTSNNLPDITNLTCDPSNPTLNQTLASSLQRSLDDSIDRDGFINAITRNASKFLGNKSLAPINQSSLTTSKVSETAEVSFTSDKKDSNRKIMIYDTLVPRRSSILFGSARNSLVVSLVSKILHEDNELETSGLGTLLGDKSIVLQPGKWRKSLNAWRRNQSIVLDKTNTGTANSSSVNNSVNQSNQLRQQQQQNSITTTTTTPNRQQLENNQNSPTPSSTYMLLSSRCGGIDSSVVKNQDDVLGRSNVVPLNCSVNVIRNSRKLSNATRAKSKNSGHITSQLPESILENSLVEADARTADRPDGDKVLLLEPTDDGIPNLPSISLLESAIEQNLQISVRSSQKSVERASSTAATTTTVADTILDESSLRGIVYNETDLNEYHRRHIYQHQLSVPLYQRHQQQQQQQLQQQQQQQQQPSIPRRRRTSVIDDHSIIPIPIPTSGGRQLQLQQQQQQKLQRHRNGTGDGSSDDLHFADFVHISYESGGIRSSLNARDRVLRRCNQSEPLEFSIVYSENVLRHCRKIGEGVYGEVFMNKTVRGEAIVLKIIPIEGSIEVNGEPQKKFDEILSEIVIAMELSRLRDDKQFVTSGFVDVKKVCCVQGRYPEHLIDLWELYRDNCGTENDHPEIFPDDQLYIVLELANGGQDLEAFTFQNALQSYSAFLQIALSLAVAEQKFQFEHRDLHWGNILLAPTDHAEITFRLNGEDIKIPTHGIKVTIIDYTLSRMVYDGCRLYNDLSNDNELFLATGDYQFDIYRFMKQHLKNQWESFEPYTNILWLHYAIDKMINGARYRCSKSKKHRSAIQAMMRLRDELLEYKSASDYVECLK